MYTAQIKNKHGEILLLSGNESRWQIKGIDGLGPARANLIITDLAGLDGGRFNSSKLETRNIVITLRLRGEVEANRLTLYRYCQTKEICTFYFSNERRSVYTRGYVEADEIDLFKKGQEMQISIICPDPYFYSISDEKQELTYYIPLFEFPFAIDEDDPVQFSEYIGYTGVPVMNDSETETGVIFNISCLDDISSLIIGDTTTEEFLKLNYPFLAGDVITINTNRGQKAIRLLRGGVESNIFSALDVPDSKFLQLAPGQNLFTYAVDNGDGRGKVKIMMSFNKKYEGV